MNDLISKSAVLDNAWQVMYKDEWHMTQTEQVVSVNDIEALPTIDAVPVVRCKDCKYNVLTNQRTGHTLCKQGVTLYQCVDFCSLGERKEE